MRRVAGGPPRCIALYKPYLTLSSFLDEAAPSARGRATLHGLGLPDGVLNVGRLDRDSEGLLLLTDDGALCHAVLQGGGVSKVYCALVLGRPTDEALDRMAGGGLLIRGRATSPCEVRRLPWAETQARLPPAHSLHTEARGLGEEDATWLELVLDEGMNRQVRRVTQCAGHPTVRLVRVAIGRLRIDDLGLRPGEWRAVERADVLDPGGGPASGSGA